jgi:hypothetical protein
LTKGDLLSDVVDECKLHVFENKILKENKDKLIDMFKFKQSKMFPVINYIHEDTVVPESDALLLCKFDLSLLIFMLGCWFELFCNL